MDPAQTPLAMLDSDGLTALTALSESRFVERKREADRETLSKVISGFANAEGGYLLLGVEDDGAISGWAPRGRAHPRDWIRDVLSERLDPVPDFDAELRDVLGHSVGVVHVPRSSQTPHFIKATGEVYERRNGQTARASPERVRSLYERGAGEEQAARNRLQDAAAAPDVAAAVGVPRASTAMPAATIASIVRVAAVDSGPGLAAWAHSSEALDLSDAFVERTARTLCTRGFFSTTDRGLARSTVTGHVSDIAWNDREIDHLAVAWDGSGLGGVRLAGRRSDPHGVYSLWSFRHRDAWLAGALDYLLAGFAAAGARGPAIAQWDLHGVRGADVTRSDSNNCVRARGVIPAHHNNVVDVSCGASLGRDTATELAERLWLQLERLAGAREM